MNSPTHLLPEVTSSVGLLGESALGAPPPYSQFLIHFHVSQREIEASQILVGRQTAAGTDGPISPPGNVTLGTSLCFFLAVIYQYFKVFEVLNKCFKRTWKSYIKKVQMF